MSRKRREPSKGKAKHDKQQPELETYRGYEGDLYMPADVAALWRACSDSTIAGCRSRPDRAVSGHHVAFTTQVADLYDFPKPSPHITKETIGLLEFSDPVAGTCGYVPSDINDYFTTSLGIGPGYVTPPLTDVSVNGATNTPGGGADVEVALDIDVAAAVAQGRTSPSTSAHGMKMGGCWP